MHIQVLSHNLRKQARSQVKRRAEYDHRKETSAKQTETIADTTNPKRRSATAFPALRLELDAQAFL